MPRTRRAAAPDAAPEEQPAADGTATTPETVSPTEPTTAENAAEPKTRRRRTPRAKTEDAETADAAAPAPEATPKRPGGRRRKTEAEPSAAPVVNEPEAPPVADSPAPSEETAPRRRGRSRRTAASEAALAPGAPISLDSVAEGVPTEETPPNEEAAPPRTKRPGGRRGRAATAPAAVTEAMPPEMPDTEAPVVETAAETMATPARRRGRRRGEPVAPAQEAPIPETEAPVAEAETVTETEEEAETEDGARRGRRRRSRRRRGDEIELPVDQSETGEGLLVMPEPVSVAEDEEEEVDEATLIAPPPPVYVAPPLVPPALAPAGGALLPRVHASLQAPAQGGLTQIAVNDTPHAPFFFFVNAEAAEDGDVVDAQIRQAADAGIHLYSGVMYLPLRNAYGDRSFGATDALVQQILGNDPDAYILPRLQCVTTNYWARTHSDQMARYADGSEGDVSLASTEFWADCVDALESLIAHFADPATPGGDRVIGFHLDRGEWFYDAAAGYDLSEPNLTAFRDWLRAKYQFPYALRAAWFNGSVTFDDAEIPAWPGAAAKTGDMPLYSGPRDGRWPDYAAFASDLVAQAITGLASAVKTLSEGRLLVAVSYGYTLEFATRNDSGHLALGRVLASPNIDILAGPNSYAGRGAGSPGAFGAPVDSVGLHGKLWLVEDDTKTFLATEDTPDTYNPKIASGADTQAAHERHFGAALAHRAGVTWMDLWGQGWLNDPAIWQELGRLRDQADRLGGVTSVSQFTPDVAVLIDEASLAYFKNAPNGLGQALIAKSRDLLLRSGASVGFYLQSDVLQENFPDAKLYLFLNALRVTSAERQAIREKLQQAGKTLAWLYAPGVFDERGPAEQKIGETVGMALRVQPWNSRVGSQLTEARSPLTDRLRAGKRGLGQDEILNPSYAVVDPNATVLAEYAQTGAASLAVRDQPGGWKSVFLGDPHLTTELLRGLYVYAGVPVYETQDDIVYASEGALLIHAPYTGQRTITLPRRATVYDAMEDRITATDTRSFRTFLRARTTRLFLWGDSDAVTRATGLTLPTAATTDAVPTDTAAALESEVPARLDAGDPSPEEDAPPSPAVLAAALEIAGDLQALPVGADDEPGDTTDTDDESPSEGEPAANARRSRWQRRRAAMRAKRDAEREARAAAAVPDAGSAANPPLDISAILPDLPPRRKAPEEG